MQKSNNEAHIPNVTEKNGQSGESSSDLYSRLLKDRIIFLNGEIDDEIAGILIAEFLFLSKQNSEQEIHFYIMSEGGSLMPSFAIYDTMMHIKCPVATYCVGYAYSAGAFLVSAGTKGRRFCLPSARMMIHQPWCDGISGTSDDLEVEAEQARLSKHTLLSYLSENCEKSMTEVEKLCQRDSYFTAEQAKEFGLIDKVIPRKKQG